VVGQVLRQGLALVLVGLGLGAAGALALGRLMGSLLYAIEPTDPTTFVAVATVLVLTAIIACLVPARRAAGIDPMIALRAS
jgi:putative ABC transport system permease protein